MFPVYAIQCRTKLPFEVLCSLEGSVQLRGNLCSSEETGPIQFRGISKLEISAQFREYLLQKRDDPPQ